MALLSASPHGLPVYGDDFPFLVSFYRPYPGHKTAFDLLGVKPVKDPAVYIVLGNTVFQREKLFQPGFFGFSVPFDVFPPFGEGHNGQEGDNDTFDEGRAFLSLDAWVFDVVKKVDYGRYSFGDHERLQSHLFRLFLSLPLF
jgi:hypothetical protein